MAINILTEPQNPPISGDYTKDQAIQQAGEVPQLSILSSWESTATAPTAKQGAYIRHAGNTFQVQSADEAISGTPASGMNYIIATESSGVITLAWATSLTGYSYNPAYGGVYDGLGNQVLRDVCYLDGSDYKRGLSNGQDYNSLVLADGRIVVGETIIPYGTSEEGSFTLAAGIDYVLPSGLYIIGRLADDTSSTPRGEVYINGAWETIVDDTIGSSALNTYMTLFSDGINVRIKNYHPSNTYTIRYRKF